jgi:hypothetical protein
MQGFPTNLERSGERLVYWAPPEVCRHFQGVRAPLSNAVPYNAKKEEECHLSIDHAPREGGKLEGLHASI